MRETHGSLALGRITEQTETVTRNPQNLRKGANLSFFKK